MTVSNSNQIGVEDLLQLAGANREAKAYAFLYAAFKRTEVSSNPVRDALDCIVPFVSPYANQVAGNQITADGIKHYLKERIGFDLPLYAIEQTFPSLQKHGYVDYVKTTRTYVAKKHDSDFHVAKLEIESDYDGIVENLSSHAKQLGFETQPPAGSWGEALIDFLRPRPDRAVPKLVPIKAVLMDPQKAQEAIVAGYVRKLSGTDQARFKSLINIFMGALIEDFISSVSELGAIGKGKPVDVFYDTAVLLRQLGCSGKMLRVATEELTQYLHDIGCNIYFFSGNENEVSNILDTILYVKDTGKEVEGETAEALATGEVSTADLRMLQNTMAEALARDNIFPAGALERFDKSAEKWQIDEKGFSEYIFRLALSNGRAYGAQNRINDAGYIGSVMRIRKGVRARDFADCGAVFVTSNRFLAYASRRYLVEQKSLSYKDCPPILSVGQIATIAWLMKDHALTEEKAGRELLLNCYATVHPDADWFKYFREGIEKAVGPVEDFARDGQNALVLQAARRIAGEESFGHAVVVRELNMVEILARAREEEQRERGEWEAKRAEERDTTAEELAKVTRDADLRRMEIVRQAEIDRRDAVSAAAENTERRVLAAVSAARTAKAAKRASVALALIKGLMLLLFAAAVAASILFADKTWWLVTVFVALVTIISFADVLRLPYLPKVMDAIEQWLLRVFLTL